MTRHDLNRPHSPSIHLLDNDSLLNVFFFCRLALLGEDYSLLGGKWVRERWWYKFTHVCRRWRYRVLGSASYLGLCLVCTYGTPVADMLAHSPLLPIIIDHIDRAREITAADEEGIMFALQHRNRVRCIRLRIPIPKLEKVLLAIGDEFPMLEYMYIKPPARQNMRLKLPKTFQAPHLRHIILNNFSIPIQSPSLTPAVGLATLSLQWIHSSAYFRPNDLLQRLSLMPQLEVLGIGFHSPVTNREVEMQLLDTPTMTLITLPNLHWFAFRGVSAYLEALLPRMTTPLLDRLQIAFFNQLTFSVPHLLQFISTKENLKFRRVYFYFSPRALTMTVYPHPEAKMYTFSMEICCIHLDWQVASAVQIYDALRSAFSAVEHITLHYDSRFTLSEDWQNAVDHTQWRELLRLFGNVKTLRVSKNGPVRQVSHSLRLDDEESPMELLPELKELQYFPSGDVDDVFTSFIDSREKVGHPITLTRLRKRLPRKS